MTAYFYITASLLLYPIIGYIIVRQSTHLANLQKAITGTLCLISSLVLLGYIANVVTISQSLNWFLATSVYLTVSVLLWQVVSNQKSLVQTIGKVLRVLIFGAGYLAATVGFLFTLLFSLRLETDQKKWLTNELMYQERNIGEGPDPSVRLKKIEVFKKISWLPIFAHRIKTKTYDDWELPLQKKLNVSFSQENQTLYLSSIVTGYKVFTFEDSIVLPEK